MARWWLASRLARRRLVGRHRRADPLWWRRLLVLERIPVGADMLNWLATFFRGALRMIMEIIMAGFLQVVLL